MKVSPKDGRCRACGGTLEIIDADDATMTVECVDGCGECYQVETDAFGDDVGFLAQHMEGGHECDT